jgi:hypothetical protein
MPGQASDRSGRGRARARAAALAVRAVSVECIDLFLNGDSDGARDGGGDRLAGGRVRWPPRPPAAPPIRDRPARPVLVQNARRPPLHRAGASPSPGCRSWRRCSRRPRPGHAASCRRGGEPGAGDRQNPMRWVEVKMQCGVRSCCLDHAGDCSALVCRQQTPLIESGSGCEFAGSVQICNRTANSHETCLCRISVKKSLASRRPAALNCPVWDASAGGWW